MKGDEVYIPHHPTRHIFSLPPGNLCCIAGYIYPAIQLAKSMQKDGPRTITFLNGKNTGRAGVVEIQGTEHGSLQVTTLERTLIDVIVRPQYAGGIRNVIKCFEKAKDRISVNEIATLLAKIDYVYPYHQALGFVLQKVGVPENSLSPLKAGKIRFKFYLDYAMKNPAFDPDWKVYYPADTPREI